MLKNVDEMVKRVIIKLPLIENNKGQIDGLPRNPRFVRDERYRKMVQSIEESPEMLDLREPIVFPCNEKYVAVCGNLRVRACRELGYEELSCKVLPKDTPVEKLREYAAKDNLNFGENDKDIMLHEWDTSELLDWGVDLELPVEPDKFKERFEAMKDDDAIYPIIPKYDEKYDLFIIQSSNEVDSNWLRERLNMQKMRSYKTGKVSRSNVIDIKDFKNALQNSNTEP